jgi:hypothetical protein
MYVKMSKTILKQENIEMISEHCLQSRQSARLFLQSSELGLPHPLTFRQVCPLPLVQGGGVHTHLRERG